METTPTTHFERLKQDRGAALQRTLDELNETIGADEENPDSEETPEGDPEDLNSQFDAFFDLVLKNLFDNHVIAATDDDAVEVLRYTVRIGRTKVAADAGAILPSNDGGWMLHLFMNLYKPLSEPAPLETKTADSAFRRLINFYFKAVSGEIEQMSKQNQAVAAFARRIRERRDDIRSIRLWVTTDYVYNQADCSGRQTEDGVLFGLQVADLEYLRGLSTDDLRIRQSFEEMGGLPCLAFQRSEEQDYDCILTTMTGFTLAQLYARHSTALVQANVRAYLGENKINEAVKETIRTDPGRFLAYNNGLVITADTVKLDNGRIMDVDGIQIINGGQTTANIHQILLSAQNKRTAPEDAQHLVNNLKILSVPVKIIVPDEALDAEQRADLRVSISEAANAQNAVKSSDLLSNSPFQIAFDNMVQTLDTSDRRRWFYERGRKSYTAAEAFLKGKPRAEVMSFKKRYPKEKKFGKTDLALAVLACEGQARACALGAEKAYRFFDENVASKLLRTGANGEPCIERQDAIRMVSQVLLVRALQKEIRHRSKEFGITNPQVPMLYALELFQEKFGDVMRWDYVWTHQEVSPLLLQLLVLMTVRVRETMISQMGTQMISMWGRRKECGELLRKAFTWDGLNTSGIFELDNRVR